MDDPGVSVDELDVGSEGKGRVGACAPTLWGEEVEDGVEPEFTCGTSHSDRG